MGFRLCKVEKTLNYGFEHVRTYARSTAGERGVCSEHVLSMSFFRVFVCVLIHQRIKICWNPILSSAGMFENDSGRIMSGLGYIIRHLAYDAYGFQWVHHIFSSIP